MSFDVEIDGQGYMVVPGTYARTQDGIGESRIGRIRVFDFFGGGQRAAQLERDRFWYGAGAWPAFDSQGVVPGPRRRDYEESFPLGDQYEPFSRTWSTQWRGVGWLVQDDRLYKTTVDGSGNYDGLSLVRTLPANVVDAVSNRGFFYFAYGPTQHITAYDMETDSYLASPLGDTSDRGASRLGRHYAWIAFWTDLPLYIDKVNLHRIEETSRDERYISSPIRAFVSHRGDCWFATREGLYRFTMTGEDDADWTAHYVSVASLPQMGYDDDLTWMASHNGDLWMWLGKEVHRYDSGSRTIEPMGLRGRATLGAASVGRYLVVNVEHELTGRRALWSWDGRGWWLLDDENDYGWPVSLWGVANDADLFAGRGPTNDDTALWQFFGRTGDPGYREELTLSSSLLDAGERDLEKVWRKIGAIFAWPDDRSSGTQDVDVAIDYSLDAGETWTQIASGTVSSGDGSAEISAEVGGSARSRFLQLRIRMSSVDDWAPVLMGMWAEHETLDLEVRRRRWRFTIEAADRTIDRQGAVDTRNAREISEDLWDAWAGRIVTFRDVDYGWDQVEYTVRVASLSETVAHPRDAATLATAELEISLVEV